MRNIDPNDLGEVIIYRSEDGRDQLEVQLGKDTVWLTLNQMADLFGRDKSVVSRHLRTIFVSGELDKGATVAKNATAQGDDAPSSLLLRLLNCLIGFVVVSPSGKR